MGNKSGVLVQNEKQANKAVTKVMRITFIIFTLVYILNVLGIFIVDMKVMTMAYVLGSIMLWMPTILVNVAKQDGGYVKYTLTICAVIFITIVTSTLGYHVVLLYIYAIAIASLYFSKRINVMTMILSVIGVSAGQIICFWFDIFPDKNFTTFYKLIVYGIIPRAMVLIAIAAIFTMLCERTAGMLSNLMNVEEQERMIEEMSLMQEKSEETSKLLMGMVKELSHITEISMESNRQIVEMDHTVENLWIQSDEVAKGMQQVNVSTQNNYQAIEQVNAATQENSAGVEKIEDMVVRIRTLAEE